MIRDLMEAIFAVVMVNLICFTQLKYLARQDPLWLFIVKMVIAVIMVWLVLIGQGVCR